MAEPNVKEVTSELVVDTPTEKVSVEELLFLYSHQKVDTPLKAK